MMEINKQIFASLAFAGLLSIAAANTLIPLDEQIATEAAFSTPPRYKYPALARRDKQAGIVRLKILVLASGKVGQIEIVKSSGSEVLDVSAKADMQLIEFTPAKTKSGVAVDSWMIAPVIYKLD
jgi:periplasmic protein TonB